MKHSTLYTFAIVLALLAVLLGNAQAAACPAGQHPTGNGCALDTTCLVGQKQEGSVCVPNITCPVGQIVAGAFCVAAYNTPSIQPNPAPLLMSRIFSFPTRTHIHKAK